MAQRFLFTFFLLAAIPAFAQTSAEIRAKAIENCKANRGVDCSSEAGLREWIDYEKARPAGQRSPLMQQKWEAERRARAAEAAAQKKAGTAK